MARRGISHTQIVTGLKIVLPLAALGLLSTLFLFSTDVDTTINIPFSKVEVEERTREQRVTAPTFSGKTGSGHVVRVSAQSAKPDPDNRAGLIATDLNALIEISDASQLRLTAKHGYVDSDTKDVTFTGSVEIVTTTGYTFKAQDLTSSLKHTRAQSTGGVMGEGPPGTFTAGAFQLTQNDETKDVYLLFTNGVKLVYDPKR